MTAGDFDGDGHLDLIFAEHEAMHLFLGDGSGGLTLAPDRLPEPLSAWSNHAATVAADFDLDGDLDVVLVNRSAVDELWWNDGSGRFTRDESVPFAREERASVGASLADVDGDGDLDLFIAGHFSGVPRSDADASALYLWTGTAFEEASTALPEASHAGYTFNGTWVDTDLDGDLDLYMVNDHGNVAIPNRLLSNDSSGGDLSLDFHPEAGLDATMLGMGIAVTDLNADARPDFIVTNFGQLKLFESLDDGSWFESSLSRGLVQNLSTQVVGWSVVAVPLLTLTASSPRPVMPLEAKALIRSSAAPVRVVMLLASMAPDVLPSRVLRTAASRVVSERVTSSSSRSEMPPES